MDLCGLWLCASSSPELDLAGADPEIDDSDWEKVEVPGHWGASTAFADDSGPVLYRRRFRASPPEPSQRVWLQLDGILSEGEVWLDGVHLGDTNLYFSRHVFEVSEQLAASGPGESEHLLAIQVAFGDSATNPEEIKNSLVGSLQSGSLSPPGASGGIWRAVGLKPTGPVAITRSRLICASANTDQATLQFKVTLDTAQPTEVTLNTSVVGPDGRTAGEVSSHTLASGENHLEWTTTVEDPDLWWPAAFGDQPLYDVAVSVRDETASVSDRREWRTGLRSVVMNKMQWQVNGQRMFVKAVVVGPQDRFLGSVNHERFRKDVQSARDAGLDMIRVYGHINRPELYQAADELGVMVWQDLPLVGAYSTRTKARARSAARAAADELGHHPSIVVWCGHEEPNGAPIPTPNPAAPPFKRLSHRVGRHVLPSWNRSVLDPLVRRELKSADPSRPVITRSGSLPTPTDFSTSDSHLWLGWRTGHAADLGEVIRRWPRLGTFLGTIGSQSVGVENWDDSEPTWATAERGAFNRYLPRGAYPNGETWAQATRTYQADVIRLQIETLRRLKYNPTGGFCVMALADAEEAGGFGVLDWHRHPKPAFNVLVDACRPVVIIADCPPSVVTPGQSFVLAIHAVNDMPYPLSETRVTAKVSAGDSHLRRRWVGEVEADTCSYIADLTIEVPQTTGSMVIDLELDSVEWAATNRYQTVIIPTAESITPPNATGR